MAAIPWWAWLGIGLFVTITSIAAGGSLQLFAWVGLLFIAVGIAKLVYFIVLNPRELQPEAKSRSREQYQMHQQHIARQPICRRCMEVVTYNDRFCKHCGLRLQQ